MKYRAIALAISSFLTIILGNSLLAIFYFPYYEKFLNQSGSFVQLHPLISLSAVKNILGYFQFRNQLDRVFFSEQALIHLSDVRAIIIGMTLILFAAVGIAICSMIQLSISTVIKTMRVACITVLGVCILIGFFSILDFSSGFVIFHQILFRNELWLFPANDNLIKIFPESFFLLFAIQLVKNILLVTAIILITTGLLQSMMRRFPLR